MFSDWFHSIPYQVKIWILSYLMDYNKPASHTTHAL